MLTVYIRDDIKRDEILSIFSFRFILCWKLNQDVGCLRCLTGTAVGHRSVTPGFKSQTGYIGIEYALSLGCRSHFCNLKCQLHIACTTLIAYFYIWLTSLFTAVSAYYEDHLTNYVIVWWNYLINHLKPATVEFLFSFPDDIDPEK